MRIERRPIPCYSAVAVDMFVYDVLRDLCLTNGTFDFLGDVGHGVVQRSNSLRVNSARVMFSR